MWQLAASTIDLGPALTQIGIGALIAVPAYLLAWTLWKRLEKAWEEIHDLNLQRLADRDAQTERERSLTEKIVPLLAQAAGVLSEAPMQFDKVLQDASQMTKATEMDRVVRRLEDTIVRMQDRKS